MVSKAWRPAAIADVKTGDPVWRNLCLKRARTLLGVPAKYPSAIVAWRHVKTADRHPHGTPPPGVPVFWEIGKYGHVAVSDGGGKCFSTDIKRRGRLDLVPISLIGDRWGARYLGWAETLNGVRVYDPSPPAPEPQRGTVVKVRAGDTMLRLTAEHAKPGTDWADVWAHPRNKDLRAKRARPELIQPGDQVWIP